MKKLKSNYRRRYITQQVVFLIFRITCALIIGILFSILGFIVYQGIGVISWEFLTESPKDGMTSGGIFPAIIGTLYLMLGSIIVAFPLGIMSGIYVSEYAKHKWLIRLIRIVTNNLAGVPSIVFGLFGMSLFVNYLDFGDSIIAGSLTLGILALPIVIRTTEEAFLRIDNSYRNGSYALGASKLQTIRKVLMPMAMPEITTGLILSMGRISGETAPILFTAAAYFLPKLPSSIFDQVMALPYHLYVISTSGTDIETSRPIAYGTALVLISIVLIFNIVANLIRKYYSNKVKTK